MSANLIRRALTGVAVLLACGACRLSTSPGIRDCQPIGLRYLWFGPSRGSLTIVPSVVEGATLDSAGWMTSAETYDIGAEQFLVLAVRLHWTQPVTPGRLAIIYRGSAGMQPIVDDALGEPNFTTNDHPDMIDLGEDAATSRLRLEGAERRRQVALADKLVRAEWSASYADGLVTGWSMPFDGCPRSAQLVRKQDLATHLVPERQRALRASLPRFPQTAGGPRLTASVDWDSLIDAGGLGLFRTTIGFVVNPTDTVLRNARVALIIVPRVLYPSQGVPSGNAAPDTIWLPLGDLPANSVLPFSGGALEKYRRIIGRKVFAGTEERARSSVDSSRVRQGRETR